MTETTPSNVPLREKPEKPTEDYPLFPHLSGQWAKKIAGKTCYFGTWDDPVSALERYKKEKADLQLGLNPSPEGLTIGELVTSFLKSKQLQLESGELSKR